MLKLEITVNFDLKLLIWQDFLELLCFLTRLEAGNIAKIRHLLVWQAVSQVFLPAFRLHS
jgi:hypothetical protein